MGLILNLETASPVCSVALSRDGQLLGLRESAEDKSHATRMTIFIQELLDEFQVTAADLDAISLSMGPGSYTGLRIGASVAKGLAYGSGRPIVGVPTLLALANGFNGKFQDKIPSGDGLPVLLCPMLDARRMEVYRAIYDTGLMKINAVEALILDSESFSNLLDNNTICFFGSGSDKAAEVISHPHAHFFPGLHLSAGYQAGPAEALFRQGEFLDTAYFEPHYLKEFMASLPKNKILG